MANWKMRKEIKKWPEDLLSAYICNPEGRVTWSASAEQIRMLKELTDSLGVPAQRKTPVVGGLS